MKDMPFFLFKNSLGAKMKKGIKTFCNNNGSTSTLNQQNSTNNNNYNSRTSQGDFTSKVSLISSPSSKQNSPTLEDLILQLELEEDMARKAKLSEYSGIRGGRMSCVNNSDILRSARNALNQYPRFSLDGRDAMYRSSFGNIEGRRSVCSETSFGGEINDFDNNKNNNKSNKGMCCLPQTLAGESVMWCKPGVVAKLMGLEAMPVPLGSKRCDNKERLIRRQQSILRKRFERQHDLERRLLAIEMQKGCYHHHNLRRYSKNNNGSCSKNGYCFMKPVALEALAGVPGTWQPRRYV